MDWCPVQGESKTLIRLTLQNPEISAGSMGHLAHKGFSLSTFKLAQLASFQITYFLNNLTQEQS